MRAMSAAVDGALELTEENVEMVLDEVRNGYMLLRYCSCFFDGFT